MKNVTNVLFVLFLILGAGFVYAGYGVCITPDTEYTNEYVRVYYPESGRLAFLGYVHGAFYPDMYCQGAEGMCDETPNNSNATSFHVTSDQWWYNDTDDDAEKLKNHEHEEHTEKGRTTC